MNFIWELEIKANQKQIPKKQITYLYPERYSPYLELNFENLNERSFENKVEINPYYRFPDIFRYLFLPDNHEDKELRAILFDLVMHHIGSIDCNKGMTKRDYQIEFFQHDIEAGLFGQYVQKYFSLFTFEEQKQVAGNLLQLYQTNEGSMLFKKSIQQIYPKAVQFVHLNERDEITVFLQIRKTEEEEKKIMVLKHLFLPFKFSMDVYYEYMLGIIEEDEFMKINEIVLF